MPTKENKRAAMLDLARGAGWSDANMATAYGPEHGEGALAIARCLAKRHDFAALGLRLSELVTAVQDGIDEFQAEGEEGGR